MCGASAVSQTPARRAQPTLVFRQIVASVQPGHALGAALVEGRGECLFAALVTTAPHRERSRPRRSGVQKIPGRTARSETRPRAARRGSENRPLSKAESAFPLL